MKASEMTNDELAKLAERMSKYIGESAPQWSFRHDAELAQRIVAELAKVRNGMYEPFDSDVRTAYYNCRAIAEEGAGDGGSL